MTAAEARRVQRFVKSQNIAARIWAWLAVLSALASLWWFPLLALLPASVFGWASEVFTVWLNLEYLHTMRRVDRIARDEPESDED